MLKFKDYITEDFDEMIEIDARNLSQNRDKLNDELDKLTEKPYQNAPIFLAQMRGVLERYGIQLPAKATDNFLQLSSEMVYVVGESDDHLYIVYDTNEDGYVDGYAQIVNSDELGALMDMDKREHFDEREPITTRPSTWYARREDDGGDTSEY